MAKHLDQAKWMTLCKNKGVEDKTRNELKTAIGDCKASKVAADLVSRLQALLEEPG